MSQNTKHNENDTNAKEAGWLLKANNIATLSASISIVISILNKLMRMFSFNSLGLVIMLYIIASIAGFLALVCSIKYAKANESKISIDTYLAGISLILVVIV